MASPRVRWGGDASPGRRITGEMEFSWDNVREFTRFLQDQFRGGRRPLMLVAGVLRKGGLVVMGERKREKGDA